MHFTSEQSAEFDRIENVFRVAGFAPVRNHAVSMTIQSGALTLRLFARDDRPFDDAPEHYASWSIGNAGDRKHSAESVTDALNQVLTERFGGATIGACFLCGVTV